MKKHNQKITLLITLIATLVIVGVVLYLQMTRKIFIGADVNGPSLSLTTTASKLSAGQTFNVNVMLDTFGQASDGFGTRNIRFDNRVLEVIDNDVVYGDINPGFTTYMTKTVTSADPENANQGTIYVSGMFENQGGFMGSGRIATIPFRVKSAEETSITFDFEAGSLTKSMISGSGAQAGQNILAGVNNLTVSFGPVVQLPTVNIKANGSDGPITVDNGNSAMLTWSSMNAERCEAANGWGNNILTENAAGVSTGNLTASKTFVIICYNANDDLTTDSVIVNVKDLPQILTPSVNTKINGTNNAVTINEGATAKLTWDSSNVNSCTASGSWSGEKQLKGEMTLSGLEAGTKNYSLTCNGDGGSKTDTSTLIVKANSTPISESEQTVNPTPTPEPTLVSETVSEPEPVSVPEPEATTSSTETIIEPTPTILAQESKTAAPSAIVPTKLSTAKPAGMYSPAKVQPWVQWVFYAIIPLVLTLSVLLFYIIRKRKEALEWSDDKDLPNFPI